jgi:hypothetical protein
MSQPVPEGTLAQVARHLVEAVRPLEEAFTNTKTFRVLMLELGWDAPGLPPSYATVADKAVQAAEALEALADGASVQEVLAVINLAGEVHRAIGALSEAPEGIDPSVFLPELARRLFEYLLGRQLMARAPGWYATLESLGIIWAEDHPEQEDRPGFVRVRFDWDQIPAILSDPKLIPERVYGWGTPDLEFPKIADLLGEIFLGLGLLSSLDLLSDETAAALHAEATEPPQRSAREALTILLFEAALPTGQSVPVGLQITELPAEGTALPGLILLPKVPNGIAERIELGRGWTFSLRAGTDLAGQLGVVARPDGLSVRYPGSPGRPPPSAGFGVALSYRTDVPLLLFGQPARTRLELTAAELGGALDLKAGELELKARASVDGLALVIVADDVDSFLGAVLGGGELRVEIPLGLTWSSRTGLDFLAGAGFEVSAYPNKDVGLVRFERVDVGVHFAVTEGQPPALQIRAAASFSGELGPIAFSVDRLGVQLPVTFTDGNAGPFDVRLEPLFPTGLGLVIDAGAVTGGGFVSFDPERGEYAGALELQLGKISLKAIGVLTTRPGDWSLLLLLYAQIPPIQLGFGFTLEGIGGLIGVQRGVDLPQLIADMKNGAFDDILFPPDPVRDAPRILSRLRTLFPARARSMTIGPMVDVHWGEPLILTARLAVLLQIDNAFEATQQMALARVVVVGQLRVAVGPTREDPDARVVLLIVDLLGFWDLADKRYGFLAVLRDSSVAGIDITGGLGVWGEYGDHPRFLLAAGGFNPRFRDVPAQMSGVLDRLGASFSVGRFNLVLTGYFALTPATIQAGMNLLATAKIGPVGLLGDIGFDVLIYRRPRTRFIADFHVIAEVTYHGHTLAGVKVTGTIEGPGRWHLVGKATFSILWWDISTSFNESWGTPAPLVTELFDVLALMAAELVKRENWSAQLPAGSDAMVTLAPRRGDLVPRAHPLGRFVFSQQVAPLGLTLEKFGDGGVSGPSHFDIEAVTIGGQSVDPAVPGTAITRVREHFARAQFVEMTEEDRLTRPAFEEMDAGVQFSSGAFEVSAHGVRSSMAYETSYLDLATGEIRAEPRESVRSGALGDDLVRRFGQYGAAGRASQRVTEAMSTVRLPIAVGTPPVAAADRRTLNAIALDGPVASAQMIAEQQIRRTGVAHAQLVEAFEVEGA